MYECPVFDFEGILQFLFGGFSWMSCGNIKLPMFISHCYIHLVYTSAIAGDRDRKRSSKGLLANQDDFFFFNTSTSSCSCFIVFGVTYNSLLNCIGHFGAMKLPRIWNFQPETKLLITWDFHTSIYLLRACKLISWFLGLKLVVLWF